MIQLYSYTALDFSNHHSFPLPEVAALLRVLRVWSVISHVATKLLMWSSSVLVVQQSLLDEYIHLLIPSVNPCFKYAVFPLSTRTRKSGQATYS